ncbi:MAG: MgtC/SapB family protein [Candidatus Aminicenantales bacterium]|jgi:putative Mg2+ transporter-C (MgtC) family protein
MLQILIKLGLSILLGGAIGLEREFGHKPAGLRTNILICLGSTMMMALSGMMLSGRAADLFDPLRVAAGVITGMGFIGAGTVIRASGHIHGLTTASTLWAVTGLGLVIGAGYYRVAVLFAAIVVVTLILFRKIEQVLPRKISFQYVLTAKDRPGILGELSELSRKRGIHLEDVVLKRTGAAATISLNFNTRDAVEREFARAISALGEVTEIRLG